jgi:hypothetical protein
MLIMGALASMAQNDYGQKILGIVAFSFSLSFLTLLTQEAKSSKTRTTLILTELASLVILSAILGCRAFYIHFAFVEYLFGMAAAVLAGIYLAKIFELRRHFGTISPFVSAIMAIYVSIILYTFSMMVTPFVPAWSETFGKAAFGVLILAFIMLVRTREILFQGEKIRPMEYLASTHGNTVVLITMYLLFTAYMGLTKVSLLPTMYSGEYPRAYVELVGRAESGAEKPKDGAFRHDAFKKSYDALVERNANVADE